MSLISWGTEKFKANALYSKLPLDDILQETGALIAGGGVLSTISPTPWVSKDLDIYVSCRNLPTVKEFLNGNGYILGSSFKASEYCASFLRRNGIRTVQTFRKYGFPTIDLMAVRHKSSPLQVVQNFDLTVCQTWYDGRDVYATHPEHILSMKAELQGDYVPVFLSGNMFLKKRVKKYNSRGYEIIIGKSLPPKYDYYANIISDRCGVRDVFKENEKGKAWARKYLFRIAMDTHRRNIIHTGTSSAYANIDVEDGYDSEDYVVNPQKILEIKSAAYIKEKGIRFLEFLRNEDEYLSQQMNPNWESDFVTPLEEELEALTDEPVSVREPSKWKGFTKKDIEFLDVVFEESVHAESLSKSNPTEVLYSMCPVCLKYIAHEDQTCMYMTHDCKQGAYYHKELYEKYKINKEDNFGRRTGKYVISWCTICGRICGNHRHYTLGRHDEEVELVEDGGRPFESDCRRTSGGGGTPEKIARFRALRAKALELNAMKGEITDKEARDLLVEAMWDGPLTTSKENLNRILAEKKFNLPTETFPNNVTAPTVYPNIPYPNVGNQDLLPILHPMATEQFKNHYNVDDENIVQFRHRKADGTINIHDGEGEQIAKSMLLNYLSSLMDQKDTEKFGMCWQYPTCNARMYPEEIYQIIDKDDENEVKIYRQYKDGFNEKFAQRGGVRTYGRKTRRSRNPKYQRKSRRF